MQVYTSPKVYVSRLSKNLHPKLINKWTWCQKGCWADNWTYQAHSRGTQWRCQAWFEHRWSTLKGGKHKLHLKPFSALIFFKRLLISNGNHEKAIHISTEIHHLHFWDLPEAFYVEAKNSGEAPDAKLFGAWLLWLATVAIESLRIS